jgi:cytohesin
MNKLSHLVIISLLLFPVSASPKVAEYKTSKGNAYYAGGDLNVTESAAGAVFAAGGNVAITGDAEDLFADYFVVIDAINRGDLNRIKELVSKGADVNARVGGVTPLLYAAVRGQKEIAEFLISKGSDVNVEDDLDEGGRTALMHATLNGHVEIVDLLISKGADIDAKSREGKTALLYALWNKKKEITSLLILRGADINAKDKLGNTPLIYALIHKETEIARLLISKGADVNIENSEGNTPLIIAISYGNKAMVEFLLSNGAEINHRGRHGETPLLTAFSEGRKEISELLESKGAISAIDSKGPGGKTSLMRAAEWGRLDSAELLIRKGANVNARDYDGRTPLMFTVMRGEKNIAVDAEGKIPSQDFAELTRRRQVAELLLLKGADVNAKDYDGRTSLMFAAMSGVNEIAAVLISKGAYVDVEDDKGNTPMTYALHAGNNEMASLIMTGSKAPPIAKTTEEPHVISKDYAELQEAEKTLIGFFEYLHDKQFDKAVNLFEPREEGGGMHGSGWEWLASSSPRETRGDKGKVLESYCAGVGTCLRVRILAAKRVDANKYRFKVQFLKDDGDIYEYGPCCGEPEDKMPLLKEFVYFVHRIDGVYKVRTPPLYRP